MKKKYNQNTKVYKALTWLFDISLFCYFCAFVLLNNETLDLTGSDSLFRNVSTLAVFFSGGALSIICKNKNKVSFRKNIYLKGYVLFFVFCLASTIWAVFPENSKAIIMAMIRIILIAYFLSVRVCSEKDVHHFMTIFVLMTLVRCVVVGIMMYGFYSTDFVNQRFGNNFDYNPNETALFCIFSVCFLIYSLSCNNNHRLIQSLELLLVILYIFVIFLTQSRKGLVGLVAAPLLFFHFQGKSVLKYILGSLFFILLVLWLVPSELLSDITGGSFERLTSLSGSNKDSSTVLREAYTDLALNIWKENPILGVGINNFAPLNTIERNVYSHNNYAELLSGVGIIGFLLYYMPIMLIVVNKTKSSIFNIFKSIAIVLLILEVGVVSYIMFSLQCIYMMISICAAFEKKSMYSHEPVYG